MPKLLDHTPCTCLWGQQALQCAWRVFSGVFQAPSGQVHNSGRDNGGSEGFAHPLISLKRCLYLMITYLGVTF